MKTSIIIPFHNEVDLISRAVTSVCLNFSNIDEFEIIICNDGSIPEEIIRLQLTDYQNLATLVIVNNKTKGPGGARNTGLDVASGEVVAFLDADDFWLPGKMRLQLAALRDGASFVATAYRFNSTQSMVYPPKTINRSVEVFLKRGIGTSTVVVSRKLLASLRFRDIRFAQDIDFWYALAKSVHFSYAAVEACCVEYHDGGSTKNKWIQLKYFSRILRINNVSWWMHIRILFSYILTGIYNHYIKRLFS